MNSTFDPLVGQVLDSRYEIVAKVARGGMATVYRARDLRLSRVVALKVMRSDLGEDDEFVAKFDREARSAAVLSHPNVVSVFDQGISQGQPYIVMEFVDGETLRRVISREAPLRPERALTHLEDVAAALASAHEAGVVHRDIKPENVLISHRGQLKVVDFGLARRVGSPQMTATGVLVGTASYLPPELVTHSRPDSRSDIYSSGVMLFELLTGTKPHTGENNYQIAYRHVNVDVPRPSERMRETGRRTGWPIPDYLDALVRAATARDPEKRIPDGRELLKQVRRSLHELESHGYADNPALAAELEPEPSGGDLTQPITPRPERPRPAVTRVLPKQPAAPVSPEPRWEPEMPASPRTPSPTPIPAPPHKAMPERPPHGPRSQRTPVFHVSKSPVHRRRRGAVALLLVILLTAGAAVGSWWWVDGRFTTVPAMANQTEAAINDAAETAELRLNTTSAHHEEVPAGQVIASDPAAGERVLRDTTVDVVISLGPERFSMPEVVGLTLDEASDALTGTNLVVGKVTEAWNEEKPAGEVLSASQEAGAELKRDTPVDLTVSKGPQPIAIENFTGRSATAAKEALGKAGFKVEVTQEHNADVKKGTVISQTPGSGNGKRGDTIAVVESLGPVMVTVPDVRYKSTAEAEKLLADAGLQYETKRASDFPLPLDIAAGTDPQAGTEVPEGTKVTLLIT
ncbi:Stk1 family PASTA domain-containing Ser/Thr kinase [Tessaracoccus oleiagri]|uniref:non-specific serine/threonine protein kinase n=1 Tax=Tessaracoccus oleiagri TaxID=686624 RepID=A0A1G9L1B3_9ACTN|nr:Stk1 family PASTA domain-containing Ser/Thr kinase [Tessaracoccus oleiagri]SDL55375.1 serine/threonine protein kinase [Tessaracoccus oleiagri]